MECACWQNGGGHTGKRLQEQKTRRQDSKDENKVFSCYIHITSYKLLIEEEKGETEVMKKEKKKKKKEVGEKEE